MNTWGVFSYREWRQRLLKASLIVFLCMGAQSAYAGTIHQYKDTLSNSAPGEYSNHTIEFKTTVEIPAGGFIRFTPDEDDFTVPAVDFDYENVDIAVATSSGYILRIATSTQSAVEDGISITPGSSGSIEVTLNSTEGIPANAYVRLRIGDNTLYGTSSDLGILNPPTTGTFAYLIEAGEGSTVTRGSGMVALVEHVTVGPLDTKEFIPPERFNGAPSGTLSGTTQSVEMSLETNEFAKCRYSTASGTPFFSMPFEFTTNYRTIHPKTIAVATSTEYTFYIRCIDDEGNLNTDDYIIHFIVPPFPVGTPGVEGDDEGQGSGTGSGSGDSSSGNGSPSGSGSGGGGSGGGSGGGGGSSSGNSTGGSDGSGGFEGTGKPYQSGDGRVIVNGYAFPRSTVYILVDGFIAESVTANTTGQFTATVDEIARGVYTFGVYAIDRQGTKSSTFSTTFSVTGGRGSTLSNVNVMPSIKVTPNPVTPGQAIVFSGYAIPNAVITIENQQDKSSLSLKTFTTTSDNNGAWSLTLDSTGFKTGTYKVRAKAKQEGGDMVETNFSGYTFYGVGQAAAGPRTSDLNRDGKVNLVDFSILLFWWNTDGGNSNPPADINADGKVSLTDFSIMIFNWTG